MKKIEEVFKFINENLQDDKKTIMGKVVKKFNVSQDSAQGYYYKWKKIFMKNEDCVPNEVIEFVNDDLKVEEATVIKGKYGIYIKYKNRVIAGDVIFKTAEDIEEYRKKEIALFYARLSEIMDVMKLEV